MGGRGASVRTKDGILLAVLILGVGADEAPKVVIFDFLLVAARIVSVRPSSIASVQVTTTINIKKWDNESGKRQRSCDTRSTGL